MNIEKFYSQCFHTDLFIVSNRPYAAWPCSLVTMHCRQATIKPQSPGAATGYDNLCPSPSDCIFGTHVGFYSASWALFEAKPANPPAAAQPVATSSACCYAVSGSSAVTLPARSSSYVAAPGSSTASMPAYYVPAAVHAGSSTVSLPAGTSYSYTAPVAPMAGYAAPSRISYVATPQRTIVSFFTAFEEAEVVQHELLLLLLL